MILFHICYIIAYRVLYPISINEVVMLGIDEEIWCKQNSIQVYDFTKVMSHKAPSWRNWDQNVRFKTMEDAMAFKLAWVE